MNDTSSNPSPAALVAEGRVRDALTLYLTAATLDPDVRASLNTLIKLQDVLREKAWSKALSYAESLSAEDIGLLDGEPLIDTAALQAQVQQLKEAGEALDIHKPEQVLTLLEPVTLPLLSAEAETLRGTALIYENATGAAKAHFERALALDPRHYRALTNLGNLALEAGDTDAAIKSYEAAILINDDFANAHHNLGVAYRRKGQVNKSVRALRKAQSASQRQLRSEARSKISDTSPQLKRVFKWVLYGGVGLIIFFVLRSRGFF